MSEDFKNETLQTEEKDCQRCWERTDKLSLSDVITVCDFGNIGNLRPLSLDANPRIQPASQDAETAPESEPTISDVSTTVGSNDAGCPQHVGLRFRISVQCVPVQWQVCSYRSNWAMAKLSIRSAACSGFVNSSRTSL